MPPKGLWIEKETNGGESDRYRKSLWCENNARFEPDFRTLLKYCLKPSNSSRLVATSSCDELAVGVNKSIALFRRKPRTRAEKSSPVNGTFSRGGN